MFGLLYCVFTVFALSNLGNFCLAARGECNIRTGPAGRFGCINIDRYQGEQYASCLSSAYIKQKSGGKHHCINWWADYCWYQCMLENHNQDNGPVSKDCACTDNPDESLPTETLPLPEKCYSPDGRDCSWYRDCLEKKHPCAGHQADYAIKFAEKFCLLFIDNYNSFSSKGQQWVDGVRKCLQVTLVPMIRPYFNGDCEDIKKEAFDSHAPCYVNPGFGVPSMCDLSCGDWLSVFWTIKSSFLTSDAFRVLTGMIEVGSKCISKTLFCSLLGAGAMTTPYGRMAALLLLLTSDISNRQKSDAKLTREVDRYELAAKITDFVAIQLKWNHDHLDWFGYTLDENIEAGENVSINIWLINKNKNSTDDLVGNEITRFEDWITSGKNYLNVDVNGVQFKPVTLSLCENTNCESINSTVIAGHPNNANGMRTFASIWITAISIFIVIKYV